MDGDSVFEPFAERGILDSMRVLKDSRKKKKGGERFTLAAFRWAGRFCAACSQRRADWRASLDQSKHRQSSHASFACG